MRKVFVVQEETQSPTHTNEKQEIERKKIIKNSYFFEI